MTYGMLINLKKCVGCHACTVACKEAHGTRPGVRRSRLECEFEGTYPSVRKTSVPMLCMHCEEAPCVEVCPTGASFKRDDGIVAINKDECIGCKTCMAACPYGARHFSEDENGYFGEALNEYEGVMYEAMPAGTMDKCTFCADRIDAGGDVRQACVAACPTQCRIFGDLDELRARAEASDGYQLLPEEGTNPSVWYLPCKINK